MTHGNCRVAAIAGAALAFAISGTALSADGVGWSPGPAEWKGDLSPISSADWNYDRAAHLLERAGFGGSPEEVQKLADMPPEEAVRFLVYFDNVPNDHLPAFVHSGLWDESLIHFPPSRPAATDLAKTTGQSMGVRIKPDGVNRNMQPASDRFFYWLRATNLEGRRVGYWWAERMLDTNRPLQEKIALLWHSHFASAEGKVRDYRKMLQQVRLFQEQGTGNFGQLAIAVAQNPAMLYYLDAGVNVKGDANENFSREVMELFTMGVGNYTERDVREAARAFTGWNSDNLDFIVNADLHDTDVKEFLGRTGNFDGVDVLNIILEQPVTAEYISGKIYKFFVREDLSPELKAELGDILRGNNYELRPLLTTVFLSKDFYSQDSYGAHIKGPVEHYIAMLNHLGAADVPGIPDFNSTTDRLGQRLLYPPSVAGWAQGKSWITPAILLDRGNVAREVLYPDILGFRDPNFLNGQAGDGLIGAKLRRGYNITDAIALNDPGMMGVFDMVAMERDELFNTRVSGFYAWEQVHRKLIPTPRAGARIDMTQMILDAGVNTTGEAVDYLLMRFLRVPLSAQVREELVAFLDGELGNDSIERAKTYMEDPLRMVAHMIMSTPEYQIN